MNEKKIYKSRDDKFVGGVCGGIAEYFDIDSIIIRLVAILLSVATSGIFLFIYILLCFLIPYEPIEIYTKKSGNYYQNAGYGNFNLNTEDILKSRTKNQKNIGIFLIIIGCILFIAKILPDFLAKFIVPIGFLVAGCLLVVSAVPIKNKKNNIDENIDYSDNINNNQNFQSEEENEKEAEKENFNDAEFEEVSEEKDAEDEDGVESNFQEETKSYENNDEDDEDDKVIINTKEGFDKFTENVKEDEDIITTEDAIEEVSKEESKDEKGEFTINEIIKMREEGK